MNNKIFEGLLPANKEAETMSKKERCEVFVVKENIGGLRYVVYKTRHNLPQGAKVLSIYFDGNKLSSMPDTPPSVQRPAQVQRPVQAPKPEVVVEVKEIPEVPPTTTSDAAEVKVDKQEEIKD